MAMNKATEIFNTLMAKAIKDLDCITDPSERVTATAELLSAIAQTGATEKKNLLVYEKASDSSPARKTEKVEESPKEQSAPSSVVAPAQPVQPIVTDMKGSEDGLLADSKSNEGNEAAPASTENAPAEQTVAVATEQPATATKPAETATAMTSRDIADTWTPEMQKLYAQTLAEMNSFIPQALQGRFITMDWLSQCLSTASDGRITEFKGFQSVPPRIVKLFWDVVKQEWQVVRQQWLAKQQAAAQASA